MGMEKRSVPRVNTSIPVEIYDEKDNNLLGVGHMWNLGINCAGLDTTLTLVKEQNFFMRFLVRKKFLINVWAKVVRIVDEDRKRYYGVKFSKIDFLNKENLHQYIDLKINAPEADEE